MAPPPGQIILLNGASSAGKTTLCRALGVALPGTAAGPFLHFSLDFFMMGADVLPRTFGRRSSTAPPAACPRCCRRATLCWWT